MTKIYNKSELKNRRQILRNNQTKTEEKLWQYLKNKYMNNLKFRRQYSFGYYIVDFYCKEKKLVIEIDGDSHFTEEGKEYDKQRSFYLESLGLKVLRFTNNEIHENFEEVLEKISETTTG